jgi:hypothetical protein
MKSFIISMPAEAAVAAKKWLVPGTSSGVKEASAAGASVGLSAGFADPALPPYKSGKVGVIKQGLVKVQAAAGTYAIGAKVELDSSGQIVTAGATNPVGTVCEDKVLAAPGELLVYVNVA